MPDGGSGIWGKPVRIARLCGFDVNIDKSWLLIAALLIWSLSKGYFPSVTPDAERPAILLMSVVAALGLFASLIVHELAHSLVARNHGIRITGITLFLFGGVAEMEEEPKDPAAEFRISVVGPLTSLALAFLFWLLANVVSTAAGPGPVGYVLVYLAFINLVLALFNLLPAFPLDGGRVYRAMLWNRTGDLIEATRRAARMSSIVAYLLIGLGLLGLFSGAVVGGLWPILIGVFLLAVSKSAFHQMQARHALHGRRVADIMSVAPWTADPEQTLEELVSGTFLAHSISFAPVVADDGPIGYISLQLVAGIDRENWGTTTVDDVFEGLSPEMVVTPETTANDLLARIVASGRRKYLVIDRGELAGVVTLSDLLAFLNVATQIAPRASRRLPG